MRDCSGSVAPLALDDRNSKFSRARNADFLAMLMAAALPWSTTAFGIFSVFWLVSVAAVIDIRQFFQFIRRPPWTLSIAIVGLAILGMFWAAAPWSARIHIAGTTAKLLALPLFAYQFERSANGAKVLSAFYCSCVVLMGLSWLHRFGIVTTPFSTVVAGVPVKNWITQGVEFVLCAFGSAALSIITWQRGRTYLSLGCAILAAAFVLNLVFVPSSRTALISFLVLLPILTYRYIGRRRSLLLYATVAAAGVAFWFASPNIRERFASIPQQIGWYETGAVQASVGLRLEYWSNSLIFIEEAPVLGHGTGSIRELFARAAVGKKVTQNEIVANPHNQTLYFALQWGLTGVILLIAMWTSHLLLFTETRWLSWMGILVVSQNIFDSIFNSHISDYVEGWIYVIGVGVCAGSVAGHFSNAKNRSTLSP